VMTRDDVVPGIGPDTNSSSDALPFPMAGGWDLDGILYDAELKKPRLLLSPSFVPILAAATGSGNSGRSQQDHELEMSSWSRYADGSGLVGIGGRRIAQFQADATRILESAPAAVSLSAVSTNDGSANVRTVSLTVRDLATGAADPPIILLKDRPSNQNRGYFGPHSDMLDVVGSRVAAIVDDQFFAVDLDPTLLAAKPRPLTLRCGADVMALDRARPEPIQYQAAGGKPPYQFELLTKLPGLTLDAATGVLNIDYSQLRSTALAQINGLSSPGHPYQVAQNEPAVRRFDFATQSMADLTGRPCDGVPIGVRIEVAARDSVNDKATWRHCLVLEVPDAEVEAALEPARQTHVSTPNATAPTSGDLQARVTALETRLADLERKINIVLQSLHPETPQTPAQRDK
jgi:hypothetical protein